MPTPERYKLKWGTVAAGMGAALRYLSCMSVQAADGFEFREQTPTKTSF
jgi:hypothetical protein